VAVPVAVPEAVVHAALPASEVVAGVEVAAVVVAADGDNFFIEG
jgi:hypothetical protein